MKKFVKMPSPAMVVAVVALVAALGGSAYAAGKIGTKQIKNNAVTTPKLAKNERSVVYSRINDLGDGGTLPSGTTGDYLDANAKIMSIKLPAGKYSVSASVNFIRTTGADQSVFCKLLDDTVAIGFGSSGQIDPLLLTPGGSAQAEGISDGGTILFACRGTDGSSISSGGRIIAVQAAKSVTAPAVG